MSTMRTPGSSPTSASSRSRARRAQRASWGIGRSGRGRGGPWKAPFRAARVQLGDGSAWDVELADSRELQSIRLDRVTDTVTIEVLDTVPGEPGFDFTAISEISVVGVAQ
jgi:hypothetical protein